MEKEEVYCPVCSQPIKKGEEVCPHCETKIKDIPQDRLPLESYPKEIDLEYGKSRFLIWIIVGIIILVVVAVVIFFGLNPIR